MKILHIPNYYYPHIGGIEQTARDCVNALSQYDQRVFCFNEGKKNIIDKIDNIEVVRAGSFAKISSQSVSLEYGKSLKKMFADYEPNIVIFHYPNPFSAHYLLKSLKKRNNCKLVVWWHLDITKQKILGEFFNGQSRRLLLRADKIIATSPNYLENSKFLPEFKNKCVVIPSCINLSRLELSEDIKNKAKKIKEENAGKTICFTVGRHVEYKGYEYLIKASKKLDDGFMIYIGGTGKLTDNLKKMADGDFKIKFLGKMTDDDLKAYLLACDIFCFPSITKNEAFGLVLAEAMYFGKPAVTFTIEGSGVNYVNLNGVTGLEVENRNVEKYAEAIITLAQDSELRKRMGDAASQRVAELFTPQKFADNIRAVVTEIINTDGN